VHNARDETGRDRAIGHSSSNTRNAVLNYSLPLLEMGVLRKHWDCQVSHLASSPTAGWNLHPLGARSSCPVVLMLSEFFLFTALSAHGEVGSTIEKPQQRVYVHEQKHWDLLRPLPSRS
jgi:hypothetical protein